MSVDMGTYHIKVEFENERGFICKIETGHRYSHGTARVSPIDATLIKPTYESEQDIIDGQVFMWTEGNFSCDCNLRGFIADAYHYEQKDHECGDELIISRMTLIRPDATEQVIYVPEVLV